MLALATTSAAASLSMSCARRASQSPRASTNVTRGGLMGSAHCRKPDRLVRRRADVDNTRSSLRSRPLIQLRFTSSRSRVSARGSVAAMCVSGMARERQVFPEMHGDVDGVGAQRDAKVAGESAAAQELGQRRVELAIAGRCEEGVLDVQTRMARKQSVADEARLHLRQHAGARA